MANLSDWFEGKTLLWQWTTTSAGSLSRPTTWWVALHAGSSAPSDATGSTGELSGSGYTREQATFTQSGQTMTLASDITFGPATGSWGTVKWFSIWSAASSGNFLAWNALSSNRSVGSGDSAKFTTSNLTITLD
jgi:hypothetical protein